MKNKWTSILTAATILLFSTLSINLCHAQNKIYPVKIGEKVPDILFNNMLQYAKPTAKLSDFKGKAVILDFWSIGCKVCIESFPKMNMLQGKFKDQIVILPIAFYNRIQDVKRFVEKRKGTEFALMLPTSVQEYRKDTTIQKLFPFYGMPNEVWIDKEGILRAVTDHYFVNENFITKFLIEEKIDWEMKTVDLGAFDKEIFPDTVRNGKHSYAYRSTISDYQENNPGVPSYYKDSAFLRLTFPNQSIVGLARYALGGEMSYQQDGLYVQDDPFSQDNDLKRLRIETKNMDRYFRREANENDTLFARWIKNNTYCYELILPASYSWKQAFKFMKADVERYFKINIKVQNEEVPYIALKNMLLPNKSIVTKGAVWKYDMADDKSRLKMINRPVELISSFIENKHTPIILNETEIKENIDVELFRETNFNIKAYNNQLKKSGLILVEKKKEMPVLFITENHQ